MSHAAGPLVTSLEEEVAALSAVVDAAGEKVSLFGGSSGSCAAMAYAAAHPDRMERLVLYGSYDRGAGRPARRAGSPRHELSERELDVLRLVAQGLSDQDIARRLGISAHTAPRHVSNIRGKLGVSSRAAATAHAATAGLL